jgi:hypothetical protein
MARIRLDKVSQRIYEAELKGTMLPVSPTVLDHLLALIGPNLCLHIDAFISYNSFHCLMPIPILRGSQGVPSRSCYYKL